MRRGLLSLVGIIALGVAGTAQAKCEKVVIDGPAKWFPFAVRDDADNFVGVGPDVAREVFSRLGIAVESAERVPWNRTLKNLGEGTVDVVPSAYHNEERAKAFRYTDKFADDQLRAFVWKEKAFAISSRDDLAGKRGARPLASSYGEEFDAFIKEKLKVEEQSNFDTAYKMLEIDRVDYLLLAHYEGLWKVSGAGYKGKIVPLELPLTSNGVHMLMSPKSECADRVDDINATLAEIVKDGTLDKIVARYTGEAS